MSNTTPRTRAVLTAIAGGLLVLALAPSLFAEVVSAQVEVEGAVDPGAKKESWEAPWRGSALTYRNVASAVSFNKDADLTYDPYYAMEWNFLPQWWLSKIFYTNLNFALTRELTESNWTTEAGETTINDLRLTVGAAKFATIPVLDIGVSAKLGIAAPTSKASQARTMILGLSPGFSLARKFDVLNGITLGYGFTFTKTFYEYTTAQKSEPLFDQSALSSGNMNTYMNTGVRNANWGLVNSFSLGVSFVEWLNFSGSVGMIHSFLYDSSDKLSEHSDTTTDSDTANQTSSVQGGSDTNVRYSMLYGLELAAIPNPALTIALGAETYNNQLAPDSTYQAPFFNRYTTIYLDLRIDIAGLTDQLTSSED